MSNLTQLSKGSRYAGSDGAEFRTCANTAPEAVQPNPQDIIDELIDRVERERRGKTELELLPVRQSFVRSLARFARGETAAGQSRKL